MASVRLAVEENSGSHLFLLVQTCLNPSEPVNNTLTMYARSGVSSFALSIVLIFGLMSFPAEIAYFNSPNHELSNGVELMALY